VSWAQITRYVPVSYGNPGYSSIQAAVSASSDGDKISIADGIYFLTATLNLNHELIITGQSEAGVRIDATGTPASSWGINPNKSNTTLSNFTILPNNEGGYPIHVGDNNVPNVISNVTLSHISIDGAKKTAFDFNGVDNLTLSYLTATNSSSGNGVQISGCKNVTAEHITTDGNAWGGFAVYVGKNPPSGTGRGSDQVTIDGYTSSFGEYNKIYNQDESGYYNTNITVNGFDYLIQNPSWVGYTFYQNTQAAALLFAAYLSPTQNSIVKQISNGEFWVGPGMTI